MEANDVHPWHPLDENGSTVLGLSLSEGFGAVLCVARLLAAEFEPRELPADPSFLTG